VTPTPTRHDTTAAGRWTGHRRGSTEYRRVLGALFVAGVATFAQLYSPQATLPRIASDLRIDPARAAIVISAATVGLAIGVIPWSVAADRLGRVRTMSIAVSAATLFGLLVPFAPTFGLLLAGRALEGLMLGGVPAIAIAYLTEEVDPMSAGRAAGMYVAGTTIGGLAGRIVAGSVAELATWRVGVFTVGVVSAISAVLFMRLAPTPRGFRPIGPDRPPSAPLAHRLAVNLRSVRMLALYAQGFLLMGGFVALYNFLGFRLAAPPFRLPRSVISLLFLAYLAGTWSSSQTGGIAARFGRRSVLLAAIALMAVGVLLTLVDVLAVVLVGLVLATMGFFAAHAVASGSVGREAPMGRAQASSLYNLFYYVGSSLFGWLGGVFFVAAGWAGTAGMIAGLAVVAGAIAIVVLQPVTAAAA
jgi:YNFM family putative membrane transporter